MKKGTLLLIMVGMAFCAHAQIDTIYSGREKIPCNVKEITTDAVKYCYPGEEVINSLYKNAVVKVVFKSGRIQKFSEALSYKLVRYAADWENVSITEVEGEIKGLYKLGTVSAKAKGTTTLSSMERVKERAIKKFKIQTAMHGGNIAYTAFQNTQGNHFGTKYNAGSSTETNLTGEAYSTVIPNSTEFKTKVGEDKAYTITENIHMWASDADMNDDKGLNDRLRIVNISADNDLISVTAKMKDNDATQKFRVIYFNNDFFVLLFEDASTVYNYVVSYKKYTGPVEPASNF